MTQKCRLLFALTTVVFITACQPKVPIIGSGAAGATARAPAIKLKVTEIATELSYPWGLAVLPDGSMLVTERDGRLRVIRNGVLVDAPITGVPGVYNSGQGGLFDIVLHPDFATNNLVYLSFAKGTKAANHTAIVRGTYDGVRLTNVQTVFDGGPSKDTDAHFGGRMLFLADKTLILTLGDGYEYRDKAQDLSTNFGKIIRITDVGQPAPDNPFIGQAGKRPEIYSYGHRNMQGLARDPVSGALFEHEHGPKGGDEINIIQPGRNYGWPVITYGVDYSGAPISLKNKQDGMEQPITYWVPSIAPSGMAFYTGDLFPAWKGDLLITALAGQQLRHVNLEKGLVTSQEVYLTEREERYRQVVQAPDGSLLLLTDDSDGKVLRVTPG